MNITTIEPGDMTRYIVGCERLDIVLSKIWHYDCECGLIIFGPESDIRPVIMPIEWGSYYIGDFLQAFTFRNEHTARVAYMAACHICGNEAGLDDHADEIDKRLDFNWRDSLPNLGEQP